MLHNIHEALALQALEPGVLYESVHHPDKMGNTANIAYGGCALAIACAAAHQALPLDAHRLYSLNGNYLGPALVDRPLLARLTTLRVTRTFTTRLVTVSQRQDDGADRPCLVAIADLMLPESAAALLTYSRPPRTDIRRFPPQNCPDWAGVRADLSGKGVLKPAHEKAHLSVFGLGQRLFEARPCPDGVFAQNVVGIVHGAPTTQDALPAWEKHSADWWRVRGGGVQGRGQHAASLAFQMDGALSFAPLSFDHRPLSDAAACSSLEFALRLFSGDFDVNGWLLREIVLHTAGEGRTYSEGVCYDASGKMVASMTQQSILRPAKARAPKL